MSTTSSNQSTATNSGGLDLRISVRGTDAVLTLQNSGPEELKVFSYVQADIYQYDWFTVFMEGHGETRTLHLYDNRDASARMPAYLAPGESLEHVIDVVAWAKRKPNGARPLAPGTYRMWATYEVSESGDVWNGKLVSPTVEINIS